MTAHRAQGDQRGPTDPRLPEAALEARLPAGFRVAAARAGIKASGGLDLAVVVVDGRPAAVAATFTTNRLPAAPGPPGPGAPGRHGPRRCRAAVAGRRP